jgi:hypothetical protein
MVAPTMTVELDTSAALAVIQKYMREFLVKLADELDASADAPECENETGPAALRRVAAELRETEREVRP